MQNKYLIATDLDGTLFGADHHLSKRTVNTVHEVVEQGHTVLVLTGRSSVSAVPRLKKLPDSVRLICSNGAYEYDRHNDGVIWSEALSRSVVAEIHQRVLASLPESSFGWESEQGLSFEDQFIKEAGGADTLEQGGANEKLGQCDVLKLCIRTRELSHGALQRNVKKLLGDLAEVSTSGAPFVEVTAPGIDKGSALARVATELGFPANRTVAFGDNLNDIPMLRWAGEAVAMGNALPEVKSLAHSHTLNNSEDGVAALLENRINSGGLG